MNNTVSGILQVRILEWVAISFSRGSSQPRDQAQVFSSEGGFFTSWATYNPFHKDMILILVLEGVFVTFDSYACHVSEWISTNATLTLCVNYLIYWLKSGDLNSN